MPKKPKPAIKKAPLKSLKEKLEKQKKSAEETLNGFAKRDGSAKDNWNASFPNFANESIEDAADEVEEYQARLPLEKNLEKELKDINLALFKMASGNYGKCEKCRRPIGKELLSLFPETKTCANCKRKPKKRA